MIVKDACWNWHGIRRIHVCYGLHMAFICVMWCSYGIHMCAMVFIWHSYVWCGVSIGSLRAGVSCLDICRACTTRHITHTNTSYSIYIFQYAHSTMRIYLRTHVMNRQRRHITHMTNECVVFHIYFNMHVALCEHGVSIALLCACRCVISWRAVVCVSCDDVLWCVCRVMILFCVSFDSSICVTCPIRICDMTHSDV